MGPMRAMLGLALAILAACAAPAKPRDTEIAELLADCDPTDATRGTCGYPRAVRHRETGLEFVLIEPRPFVMGSKRFEVREHRYELTEPYYIATTEVTVAQWRRFAEATGYLTQDELRGDEWNWRRPRDGGPVRDDHPVSMITFFDARMFCAHYRFSLPSEAQWEYACRAGSTTDYWWGEDPSGGRGYGNFDFPGLDDGFDGVAPVRSFAANPFGLFDMLGNVAEWCLSGPAHSTDPNIRNWGADPVGRGGWHGGNRKRCSAAYRLLYHPDEASWHVGFRPAFTVRG